MENAKIPRDLWRTQLLNLVKSAPKAHLIPNESSDDPILPASPSPDDSSSSNTSLRSGSSSHISTNGHNIHLTLPKVEVEVKTPVSTPSALRRLFPHRNPSKKGGRKAGFLKSLGSKRNSPSPVSSSDKSGGSGSNPGPLGPKECWERGDPGVLFLEDQGPPRHPFGPSYHGWLNSTRAGELLRSDGDYLVRKKEQNDEDYVLSFRFNGQLKNFSLSWDESSELFYLGSKGYPTLNELVQEGLVTLHLEQKAGSYIDLMVDLTKFHLNNKKDPRETLKKSQSPINSMERRIPPKDILAHSFQIHSFQSLSKCDVCGNFLWGTSSQGIRCKDCGLGIHEGCSVGIKQCTPSLELIPRIFGNDLTQTVKACGGRVPFVMEKLIVEIERKGLNIEGIYRVSGSKEHTERLKTLIETERDNADLSPHMEIHSMCGLVKLYLRQLPTPLITTDVFERFLNANGSITLEGLRRELLKLPPAHLATLKYLLLHLNRVTRGSNKMNSFNLSSVFTPTIVAGAQESLGALKTGTAVLEMMISNAFQLFPVPSTVIM